MGKHRSWILPRMLVVVGSMLMVGCLQPREGAYLAERPYSAVARIDRVDGAWHPQPVADSSGRHDDERVAIRADGRRLYFSSPMPLDGDGPPKDYDIWYVERVGGGWGEAQNLGPPINTDADEIDFSLAADGTLYFNREDAGVPGGLLAAEWLGAGFAEPRALASPLNGAYLEFAPTIAPDRSYLVFTSAGRPHRDEIEQAQGSAPVGDRNAAL